MPNNKNNTNPPKVFISYSWDSNEHKERILKLSTRLRDEGVDCQIDQYVQFPSKGWLHWMEDQLEWADFVLVVCTEKYEQRFRGKEEPDKGLGVTWEGAIITAELYRDQRSNTKFIPVVFSSQDFKYIPTILISYTRYLIDIQQRYLELYSLITNQHNTPITELGTLRRLPSRERQHNFEEESPEKMLESLRARAKICWQKGSGYLDYRQGIIDASNSTNNVKMCNFIVEAKFYNPYNGAEDGWQYGFSFRETSGSIPLWRIYLFWENV
ncbi:SEFIR domain-containing protein [Nostoc sp.]|uniref:SEFIR domain-containing protein n=1 Tax=Nostoc sp. TaxID=1180 RepID=UPI002FFAF447